MASDSRTAGSPARDDGLLSRLRRLPDAGWIAGVCAGLADYSGWSVKLIRVLFLLALIFSGFFPAGLVYLVLWYLMDPAEGQIGVQARTQSAPQSPAPMADGGDAVARFEKLDRRLASMEACVAHEEFELRRQFRNLEG